jgi:hypothetical protein
MAERGFSDGLRMMDACMPLAMTAGLARIIRIYVVKMGRQYNGGADMIFQPHIVGFVCMGAW